MLTSLISKLIPITRNAKNKSSGGHEVLNFSMPSAFKLYTKYMGGTDLMDQLIEYYRPKLKNYKWQTKVYIFFVFAAIANAHVLYKKFGLNQLLSKIEKKATRMLTVGFYHYSDETVDRRREIYGSDSK